MAGSSTEAPVVETSNQEVDEVREVEAWRFFALDDNGVLIAPFWRFWPSAGQLTREWPSAEKVATCVAEAHEAPANGCTCGLRGIEDIGELLSAGLAPLYIDADTTVLIDAGIIAKVALSGKVLPGANIPADDPATTWRASRAKILGLHVAPKLTAHADALAWRYLVPVFCYDDAGWPRGVPVAGKRVEPGRTAAEQTSPATEHVAETPKPRRVDGEAWTAFDFGLDFGLGSDALLLNRFTQVPSSARSRVWPSTKVVSACQLERHSAPATDCTCGIRATEDLGGLLASHDGAMLAKVALWGRKAPTESSQSDSPTFLRAEGATLIELHLPPSFQGGRARLLAESHPDVAVYCYDNEDWPSSVPSAGQRVQPSPEARFVADVRRAGLGRKDVDDPAAVPTLLSIGRSVCSALRSGVSLNDVLGGLFRSAAAPTFAQVEALHRSAVANLCPECEFALVDDDYRHAEPVTFREDLERRLGRPLTIAEAMSLRSVGRRR